MIDLNKYIVDPEPGKPFHSNGYAKVANGGRIGSVSTTSFNDRQRIEQGRRAIGSYNRSIVGQAYGVQRAKMVTPGGATQTTVAPQANNVSPLAAAKRGFKEPSGRLHNPLG
ncbi:MAG: hypothetical protein ABI716_01675 [Candidatus Saccharibacteria bacterium]